jgi:DNA-binding CsgD family transcriptional regulator
MSLGSEVTMARPSLDIAELILSIHSASLSPHGWQAVMRELMQSLGGHCALIHGVHLRPDAPKPWALLEEFDPCLWHDFATYWVDQDAWRLGAQRSGRFYTGCVSVGEQLVDRREFVSSAYYNELLKRGNLDRLLSVLLLAPSPRNDVLSVLCLYRGIGKTPFSSTEVAMLSSLAPHLVVAARNFFQAESLRLLDTVRRDAIDAVSAALLAIDCAGHLVFANRSGEELLQQGMLLRLVGGLVCPGKTVADAAAVAKALAELRRGLGTTLLLTDALTNAETVLTFAPATQSVLTGRIAGLIWSIPTGADTGPVQQIARLFELTAAEQRLLRQLADGDDLCEAAASLQLSIHTAHNQLQSIFRKTGRGTQAQLLQLVSRMAAIAPP